MSASASNVVARVWEAGVGLAVVPIILRKLGGESYGLIAFTQSLFAIIGLLDFGLSAAATRELARGEVDASGKRIVGAIVRTLEYPLWGISVLVLATSVLGSGWLAANFLKAEALPIETVAQVLQLFAFSFVFRWMAGFYRAVFYGLERQILFNTIVIFYVAARYFGAVVLLSKEMLGISGLFFWYTAVDGLFFFLLRMKVLAIENAGSRVQDGFSLLRLRSVLSYAMGTMGLAVVGVLVMQADKILIANHRPLQELGAYTLAFTLAMGIRIIPGAIWTAAFPRLVNSLEHDSSERTAIFLRAVYSVTTTAAFCVAVPITWFSNEVIDLMAGQAIDATLASAVLVLLAIGTTIESLNAPCYQQLLAAGHSRALLKTTFMLNLCYVTAIAVGLWHLGIVWVAACWPLLQTFLFWFYARQAKSLCGASFSGALKAIFPRVLVILLILAVVRLASTGLSTAAVCIAAGASGVGVLFAYSISDARRVRHM